MTARSKRSGAAGRGSALVKIRVSRGCLTGSRWVKIEALVISGQDDQLIRWTAGRETANRIPGARFVNYPSIGHAIPAELFDDVVDEITRHAGLAGSSA